MCEEPVFMDLKDEGKLKMEVDGSDCNGGCLNARKQGEWRRSPICLKHLYALLKGITIQEIESYWLL